MAVQFSFGEDNGAEAGDPLKGATRAFNVTQCNWKNTDDVATAYSSSPITAGNNSYGKYQFGVFTGSFNEVSNVKFGHTTGIFGGGLTLVVKVDSGYNTPATTALSSTVDITLPSGIAAASQTLLLGQNGPDQAGEATLTTSGYSQYFATQLQTTTGASPGDTATATLTVQYDES